MSGVLPEDAVAVVIDDDALIATLIASHGDVELAAERVNLTAPELVERLPSLDHEKLVAGIKVALTVQTFLTYTAAKEVALTALADMTPQQVSKFLLELTDRLSNLVAPPAPTSVGAGGVTFNLMNQQMISEQASARDKLLERVAVIDVAPGPSEGDRELESGGATPTPIRLGVHGEAESEGTP